MLDSFLSDIERQQYEQVPSEISSFDCILQEGGDIRITAKLCEVSINTVRKVKALL